MSWKKDKTDTLQRRNWLAVLAKSSRKDLEEALHRLPGKPQYHFIRPPETGAIMIRARAGGSGLKFNFGEATISRSIVKLENGSIGCGYVMGRDQRHAELVSVFDGLLQDQACRSEIFVEVIVPLETKIRNRNQQLAQKTAATKVDFFTLVRGE